MSMKIRYLVPMIAGLLLAACKDKEPRNEKHSGGNGPAVPLIRDSAGPKVPGPGSNGPYAPGPSGGAASGGAATVPAPDTTGASPAQSSPPPAAPGTAPAPAPQK